MNLFKRSSFVAHPQYLGSRTQAAHPSCPIEIHQDATCFLQFFVEIKRFPLRSRTRITSVHQPVGMRVSCFVTLTGSLPTPISLISSRPESSSQVPPHKLINHTTDTHGMLFSLDFPRSIHPIDDNLVVTQYQTTMFIRAPSNSPGIAVISWSLFTFHRASQLTHEDSGGFRFNITYHDCSNYFVKEFHSAHVLHALIFEIQASPKKRVKRRSQ